MGAEAMFSVPLRYLHHLTTTNFIVRDKATILQRIDLPRMYVDIHFATSPGGSQKKLIPRKLR